MRRTTSIDTIRSGGPHGPLVVDARGRNLHARAERDGGVEITIGGAPADDTETR